ncbi:MAG: MinD/ParA family protein [Proteobacteria bacterium]|nr:MinD/ParA family protein [Pseudomonadota bacterium]MBU1716217.1 MinD/ParA family protein [Pseudomonadota bacterium]
MTQAETLEKIMSARQTASNGNKHPGTSGPSGPSPRVICITSGKGGVGKTNITTNLAFSLCKNGKKVMILDADLNLANIDVLLGLTPKYNINHVLAGEKTLAEVMITGPGGMMILPASSGIMELADLTEKQKLYFMSEMETIDQAIDFLLIDTAAGINNNVVYFNLAAQERFIILSPEPTSLTDAYALIKVLSTRHDVKKFRILVNLAQSSKEALTVFRKLSSVADRFLDTISLDYIGQIPLDNNLPLAVRRQKLVTELYPTSPASKTFFKLSEQLIEEEPENLMDGNIKFLWKGMFDL